MPNAAQIFLDTIALNFLQNRLGSVADNCVFPLPVYAQGNLLIFGTKCTFLEVLQSYSNAAHREGVTEITPRVLAEGLPVNGYSNVWVEWDHFDADSACLRTSQVRYVFYRANGALFPRIEMIEYTELAYPDVHNSFAQLRIA